MTLDQIRTALADRNLSAVARATGLSMHTLYRLVRGQCRPHNATLRIISDYLTKA